jgi:ferredoxin
MSRGGHLRREGPPAELNARLAAQWPVIVAAQDPLPDAEHWANQPNKRALLTESAATA